MYMLWLTCTFRCTHYNAQALLSPDTYTSHAVFTTFALSNFIQTLPYTHSLLSPCFSFLHFSISFSFFLLRPCGTHCKCSSSTLVASMALAFRLRSSRRSSRTQQHTLFSATASFGLCNQLGLCSNQLNFTRPLQQPAQLHSASAATSSTSLGLCSNQLNFTRPLQQPAQLHSASAATSSTSLGLCSNQLNFTRPLQQPAQLHSASVATSSTSLGLCSNQVGLHFPRPRATHSATASLGLSN